MNSADSTKHILIVEDSKDIQDLLARLLNSSGYKTDCANNGLEALEFLHSLKILPGLILLDLMMPEMDGYGFREAQAKIARFASIPIIVMTAHGDVQSKALKIGAKASLKKPFSDIETILDTIGRFFPK